MVFELVEWVFIDVFSGFLICLKGGLVEILSKQTRPHSHALKTPGNV